MQGGAGRCEGMRTGSSGMPQHTPSLTLTLTLALALTLTHRVLGYAAARSEEAGDEVVRLGLRAVGDIGEI